MRSRSHALLVVACSIVVFAAVFVAIIAVGATLVLAGLLALVACAALLLVPRHWLPSVALVVFAVLPRRLFPFSVLEDVTPAMVVVTVWALRSWTTRGASADRDEHASTSRRAFLALIAIFLAWALALTPFSINVVSSARWTIAFAVCVALPMVAADDARTRRLVQTTWIAVGVLAAAYAALEFVLQRNPIYDPLYATLGQEPLQKWSVYRASASFGHPLHAGVFMAMGFGAAVGRAFEGSRLPACLGSAAVLLVGIVLTASRSALAAAAIAAVVMVAAGLVGRSSLSAVQRVLLALGMGIALAAATGSGVFQERLSSTEGIASAGARETALRLGLEDGAQRGWVGSGPGTSASAVASANTTGTLIESAYIQLLVSLGIPGLLLFVSAIVISLVVAARRRNFAGIGMLSAFAVMVGAFNIVESSPGSLILLGFAVHACWARRDARPPVPSAIGRAETTGKLP